MGMPRGVEGGGFLYTNRRSISLGLILKLGSLVEHRLQASEVLETFKGHPFVSRLVRGGTVTEYSTCLVAEGGIDMVPRLFTDGALIAGSAAGLVLNNGFNLRGMDFAIASGAIAGRVAAKAAKGGVADASKLRVYQDELEKTFVIRELEKYRKARRFLDNTRLYSAYPESINAFLHNMYSVSGEGRGHLLSEIRRSMDGVSALRAVADAFAAARAL